MNFPWCYRTLWLACVLLQANGQQAAGKTSSPCGALELCVTEQRCNESDDSGHGIIGPRMARTCGEGLVCCDQEQLESWDAMQVTAKAAATATATAATTTRGASRTMTEEESMYESCGVNMECVPRKLCRDNKIIDDGRFILNPRIGATTCPRALERCCAVDQQVEARDSPYVTKLREFKYQGCGWSNPKGLIPDEDNYEYQEDVALFAEFPWMVALMTGRQQYLCGGTLIHPQLVLTSSHNVRNQTVYTLLARFGEWDLTSFDEPHEHQTRRIKQIVMHEQFDPKGFFNDIALLVLEQPVEIQPHVQPICLPPPETDKLKAELREAACYATGWGGRQPDSKSNERLLKRIELPVVGHMECQGLLRVTPLGKRFRLRNSFLCAGGIKGKDTCKGDGGSPLFCTMPGQEHRYRLAGIVSWGIDCASEDVPAVYANVPHLRSWIDAKVKSLGFEELASH